MSEDLIFITGASSDIGMALARRLLATDTKTKVLAHSFSGGERIAALQAEFDTERVLAMTADLSDMAAVSALGEQVLALGTPRAFVHLPALRLNYDRFTKLKWDRFSQDMTVQVQSAAVLLQKLLPKMAKVPGSRVLFVLSSVVHGMPPKFMSDYTVVKYAQLGLMRAVAAEYAATSVRINAISPSMIDTQFVADIAEVAREMAASANPLGRNAKTDDLLGAMELLLGPEAEYIHGVELPITAGTSV
jgi:3-oxoacyl-[acyl-carrier protein] reductase